MGKRVKKKAAARTVLKDKDKEKRVSSEKTVSISEEPNQVATDGPVTPKKSKVCAHLDKAIDLEVVSNKLQSAPSTACEYCRQGKSKGKNAKKKSASDSTKATWICLQCAHFSCGPVGLPTNPQSHALRHARQTRHPLVIQAENPHLRWCFSCSTLLPVYKTAEEDIPQEKEKEKDVLGDVVKLLRKQSSKAPSFDVEDIWFGSGSASSSSASVLTQVKAETKGVDVPNGKDFYAVRGLSNLGNTCFFNSVLQNLLAMDLLRDYLLNFEESIGPLTSAFKKIFVETCPGLGLRNVLNPKPLFGCICAKAPQFRGYQQQDSHELLRYLLDGLSSEFLQARKSVSTLHENVESLPISITYVDALFGGQTSSTVCCLECGHSSVVYEPFLDLSLPVPTKKSPLKKAQPLPRTKKTKPPPKRGGRTRPKLNKSGDLGPVHNGNISTSMESFSGINSGDMGSAANGSDTSFLTESSSVLKGDSLSCAPSAKLSEPSNGDHKNVLVTQDNDSPQQDYGGAQMPQAAVQDADGMSCLDYVEPSSQSEGAKEVDSFAWLDYVEPVSLLDDPNLGVADEDFSVFQDLGSLDGNHDAVSMQDTAKESVVEAGLSHVSKINGDYHDVVTVQDTVKAGDEVSAHLENVNFKSDSIIDDWGDERPLLVQDNEILLLTYKEDGPMEGDGMNIDADISSSTVVDGEDTMGFDGLGDLFNEPDAVETSVNDVPVNESLGNGFLVGNYTESDPDEVDDTDSPVSVESCLAHFMKPERLSGEHAWHCENCTKLLKEERERIRKNQKKSALIHTNMQSDVCLSSEVVQAKEHAFLDSSNSLLATHNNGSSGRDENLKRLENRSSNGFCQNSPPDEEERLVRETAHLTVSSAVCFGTSDETNLNGKIADSYVFERPPRLSEEHGLGEDEKEKVDLKCVKVMRDATKRLLINKAPPVLTIHLKRFGQDARGRLSKLNGHVVFKEYLDLGPYVDCRSTERDKCLYHLVGVVEHSGSMRGGHYVAYVRGGDRRRGRSEVENTEDHSVWYHASDAYVRKATLEEVLGCEAYILFYEKVKP